MTSRSELLSRIKTDFRFSKQELTGIVLGIIVTAFIFSFRDWGAEVFNAAIGINNLFLIAIVAGISFFFRITCQKLYGLAEGHKTEFKVWWSGLVIALVVGFISMGAVPLIFMGTIFTSFMVRQRIGEFRYGFNYWANGMTAYWGVMGNMILATCFAIFSFFYPSSYFFSKGIILNIIMAICAMIPIPQLDGLTIFMGSRGLYYTGLVLVLLGALLLLTKTAIGLFVIIILGLIYYGVWNLVRSEK